MKAVAFNLIDASPLALIRGIYSVDCKKRKSVKKTALSDHREFCRF